MAGQTEFEKYLAQKLKEDEDALVPVKAGALERMFVKKADIKKLHPNPEDEFCDPAIGPNDGIISDYMEKIRISLTQNIAPWDEPLIVEKVHPEGYMLLNGHHRWAAALKIGYSPVGISIVNLTQAADIERMVRNSRHTRRVTLDLDELVFCTEEGGVPLERPLSFPMNRIYRERIRLGIPSLLHFLSEQGYDIWVYSARFYSIEYIRGCFRRYGVQVDGIVTGAGRRLSKLRNEIAKRTEKMITDQYGETLHIDSDIVLRTVRDTRTFEEYPVTAAPEAWSGAVKEIVRRLNRGEEER